ncbi:hypothetical protein CDAR_586161 [Caerostris darwini]|uniref:Uncharacterized protein n=1 Tax=Caerostris darwini TaxID=1538125 RepID=A0AAV4UWE4_9ARAC|nr:hypothetical protein CDAR_586161 [Caerostris darwini]
MGPKKSKDAEKENEKNIKKKGRKFSRIERCEERRLERTARVNDSFCEGEGVCAKMKPIRHCDPGGWGLLCVPIHLISEVGKLPVLQDSFRLLVKHPTTLPSKKKLRCEGLQHFTKRP